MIHEHRQQLLYCHPLTRGGSGDRRVVVLALQQIAQNSRVGAQLRLPVKLLD